MAKKHKKQAGTGKVPAARKPAEAARGEASFFAWHFWVRLGAAGLIAVLAVSAVQFYVTTVRAHAMALEGSMIADRPGGMLVGRAKLREAHQLFPHDPQTKIWLAEAIINYENSHAAAGNLDRVNFANLREALDLLDESRKASIRPSSAHRTAAEAANVMRVQAGRQGRHDVSDTFNEIATNNYLEYRFQQGFPFGEDLLFYRNAIGTVFRQGRPHVALLLYGDILHYRPDLVSPSAPYMNDVQRARLQMGEFHLYMATIGDRLWEDPGDAALYSDLYTHVRRLHQQPHGLRILQVMDRQGELPPAFQRYLELLWAE